MILSKIIQHEVTHEDLCGKSSGLLTNVRRRVCKENDKEEPTERRRRARSGRLWGGGKRESLGELGVGVANKFKRSLEVKQVKS